MKNVFDCHTHTCYSHDSDCDPKDSLRKAKECGLGGFAITDHCDIEFCEKSDVITAIKQSTDSARKIDGFSLAGVEIGEGIWQKEKTKEVLSNISFDIVLGSVHAVRYKEYTMPYSKIDFSAFSSEETEEYVGTYFNDVLDMIKTTDFDVLSHLTCPLRYICGKYGIKVDLSKYNDKIETILQEIIKRKIALEINTSCLGSDYDFLMPNLEIVKSYKELGGHLLTLGSDAHKAERIGYGFDYALGKLSDLGFENIYYYKNRKPVLQEIKI